MLEIRILVGAPSGEDKSIDVLIALYASDIIKGVENDVCYFNINYINSIIYIEKTSV